MLEVTDDTPVDRIAMGEDKVPSSNQAIVNVAVDIDSLEWNTRGPSEKHRRNSPSDAALSQTPGHPAAGGFCPETRGKKGLERITGLVTEGRCFT